MFSSPCYLMLSANMVFPAYWKGACIHVATSSYVYIHLFAVLSTEWPLTVVDASKTVSSERFHKQLEEAALTVKTCYWYVIMGT